MVNYRTIGVAFGLATANILLLYFQNQQPLISASSHTRPTTRPCEEIDDAKKHYAETAKQRNELSASLNRLQEQYQQLVCQTKQHAETSETGGWCDTEVKSRHVTDGSLVKGLEELLFNKTVLGLGDGPGKYRQLLLESGAVKKYDSYDGAPNIKDLTNGQVSFLDLTLPQYWLPVYDWVMILEVLEHIPAQYEDIVLDNVVRHAGIGVIISWAVPGQDGNHHINCRPPEYVQSVMKLRNFNHDSALSLKLQQKASLWWLQNNIQVFTRV